MANLLYKIKATDEVKGRAHASLGTVDSGILSKARIFTTWTYSMFNSLLYKLGNYFLDMQSEQSKKSIEYTHSNRLSKK